jgi:hypothetical protein
MRGRGVVMKEQCGTCSNFLLRSTGNFHNWCRHVAWFWHPSHTKQNSQTTTSKKHSCINNACSEHCATWQTDVIGIQKCDLGLTSHLLSPRQLQQ